MRSLLKFLLLIIAHVFGDSARTKREPTMLEIIEGEKLPCTDEYFIPDKKYRN